MGNTSNLWKQNPLLYEVFNITPYYIIYYIILLYISRLVYYIMLYK